MSDLVTVEVKRGDSSATATVRGEIDVSNSELVRTELEEALTAPRLTVDLTGLEYLDSAGVRALFAVAESAQARATELVLLVRRRSPIRRVLEVAGLDEVVRVLDDDALEAELADPIP